MGSGGSIDERISSAKSEIIGDAAEEYNTLGKLEDKLQEGLQAGTQTLAAETQARINADESITSSVNSAI